MHVILLGVSICIAIISQLLFKAFSASERAVDESVYLYFFDYRLILGFFLYFISAVLYILALKKIDLSVAYPTISISYIFIIVLSHFIFGETLTTYKILGSVLIVLGVSLIWK
jgi:small multidrug resistance pump